MADSKITALTAISTVDPTADPLVIVDVSDTSMAASGTTKKSTINQLLGAGGTATLASATITGDLTVDTSTLKVDSANDRVGIGTATLFGDLNIQNGTNCRFELGSAAGGTVIENLNNARNAYLDMTMYADAYIWNRLGSEVMRLNSTGLGVGVSPSLRLEINSANNTTAGLLVRNQSTVCGFFGNEATYTGTGSSNNTVAAAYGANSFIIGTNSVNRLTVDSSGNVGIGVTPSAYGTGIKGLDLGAWTSVAQIGAASFYGFNSYASTTGQFNYKNSGAIASGYFQTTSGHLWLNAPSNAGAAGANATFTTAMTLDTSGRLILLASTTTPATLSTNGQLTFTATSDTNLRFSYRGSDGTTRVANITLA